jgi:hypothetical protein
MAKHIEEKSRIWPIVTEAPWSGDEHEVALISSQTGRLQIDVRRAIMKVGSDRRKVIAELTRLN